MVLSPGTRLGPYEIVAPLGAGGMGEVYRAKDTRLGREVAIKVLPERLAHDPDALARFEREARAVAALSHPNLLALHDVGRQEETAYAVMELLEGETLRARLLAGALPVRRALEYGVQITQGLAAAHEKGIVHRDLKPENLFVTSDGRIKILDFGLAAQRTPMGADVESSPTQTRHTDPGQVLGTVGYMSPEQVRGQTADTRSDIFSFGVVLFEMLSGRRPFHKETAAETMTAILREEPPDLLSGRDEIPAALAQIVYHCLEKDPAARVNSARDLAFDLQLVAGLSSGRLGKAAELRGVSAWRRRRWAWAVAGALAGGVVVALTHSALSPRTGGARASVVRLSINLPERLALSIGGIGWEGFRALALSPDGSQLVYRAHTGFPTDARLYLRSLSATEALPLEGSETATAPLISPDGGALVFFDSKDSQFKKVRLTGGPARVICKSESAGGASVGEDGRLVFPPTYNSGLARVSSEGGTPDALTTLDNKTETSHAFPQVLPGGGALLFTVEVPGRPWDDAKIVVQDLRTGRRSAVVDGGTAGRYVPTGHILYGRHSSLMAVPFDLSAVRALGPPVKLIEDLSIQPGMGVAQFDVSEGGTLAYISGRGGPSERTLVWVDRRGAVTPATTTSAPYNKVSTSPDGKRAVAELFAADNDIWLLDFANGALTRRTFDHENGHPLWTPNGQRLIFRADYDGAMNLYALPVVGAGRPERLTESAQWQFPSSIARDGSLLLFEERNPRGDWDVWMLPLRGDGKPAPVVQTAFNESRASFSPDGHLLAYQSDESGRSEIYVEPFPGSGSKHRISLDGGTEPQWSPDSRELYFQQGPKLMTSRMSAAPTFSASRPEPLFEVPWARGYTVAPDGRFLVIRASEEETSTREIHVILNFFEELKRRVPPAGK